MICEAPIQNPKSKLPNETVEVNPAVAGMVFPLVKRDALPDLKNPTPPTLENRGGGERIRTDGLLRARQALSQLSYTPESCGGPGWS